MTKFYVVRHGQSLGNSLRKFFGHTDHGMTELGHSQGKRTGEYLRDKGIEALYSSDLPRALDTARHIGAEIGLEPKAYTELREIYAGEWEGKYFDELLENYPNYKNVWKEDIGRVVCDGGESAEELLKRAKSIFEKIAIANTDKTVCVATHATVIRVMCCLWQNRPLEDAKDIPWVSNASVTEVTYDGGKWHLEVMGYDKHLDDLVSVLPANV